jgi:hypothetical protein
MESIVKLIKSFAQDAGRGDNIEKSNLVEVKMQLHELLSAVVNVW